MTTQPLDARREAVLEGQPTDPAEVEAWLKRLHDAATALLPETFTINAAWNVTPHEVAEGDEGDGETIEMTLHLTFHRHAPDWDPGEVQYRVTDDTTVPHHTGTGASTVPATALCFTGRWLNRHRIPRPLTNSHTHDFGNSIIDAVHQDQTAEQAILLAELVRVIRLRQRVGETDIRNGGHDTDIDNLQDQLHDAFSITRPSSIN